MAAIYVFFADGMEEIEALTPVDVLRRAGDTVITVSIMGRKEVVGSHAIRIEADQIFEETSFEDGDVFLLPGGGGGTEQLGKHTALHSLLMQKQQEGKRIAAICAAPSVLGKLGLLEGKQATIYPGMEEALCGGQYQDVPFVTDGEITTGHGPGAAMDFALELVRLLHGEEIRLQLKKQLVYPYND